MRNEVRTFCIVMLAIFICRGCREVKVKHYDHLASVQREQMIEKGWIPEFISPDAKNIAIDGDLDSASVSGSYVSGDIALLREHCGDAPNSLRVHADGPKWFANDVRKAEIDGKLRDRGYEVFNCPDGFQVVVSTSRSYISYWSTRR